MQSSVTSDHLQAAHDDRCATDHGYPARAALNEFGGDCFGGSYVRGEGCERHIITKASSPPSARAPAAGQQRRGAPPHTVLRNATH